MPRGHPHLRLVQASGSIRRRVVPEVPLEPFKRLGGKGAPFLKPLEKLPVVDNQSRQPRLADIALFAKASGIVQKLVLQGHCEPSVIDMLHIAGFPPHKSTGFFPHEFQDHLRDNARSMDRALISRIKSRLDELEMSANAASSEAGLHRDYLSQLFNPSEKKRINNPRRDTLRKLAKALKCNFAWLAYADGAPDLMQSDRVEAVTIINELPTEELANALAVLRALRIKVAGELKPDAS